mmetsp:Transcript_12535/g.29681  ORF Transcript_12535/g.29681 Transcript_12535/m.29681 type:complete len:708 (+) Transcript_12535:41-2164(+)
MKYIAKYPWFWTSLIALVAYFDVRALTGGWVYDDAGSVVRNIVVNGMVDWREAFTRDYWGTEMKEVQSHKSFRPITTLTLKANYVLAKRLEKYQKGVSDDLSASEEENKKTTPPPTWTFKVVNLLLHGIVTGLITKATSFVLPSRDPVLQIVVGSLFAVHPVHAEVVSNVTSRGEMLMSIFFLIAFLSFARTRQICHGRAKIKYQGPSFLQQQNEQQSFWWQRLFGIYLLPWLCMTLSMFSKEQGATTLISLVAWDFLTYHGNLMSLQRKFFLTVDETKKDSNGEERQSENNGDHEGAAKFDRAEARQFVGRTVILAIQTLVIIGWRFILNGESSPDFIEAQNPAGFAKDRFTRAFSITWVYCLYIRDALYPYYLSPDWSGISIDLVSSLKDPRAMIVLALWYFAAQSFWSMIVGAGMDSDSVGGAVSSKEVIKDSSNKSIEYNSFWNETTLRQVNIAVWAFTFSPFLLSSNILVVVGLMKADRVIYLPLFGFCLLEALLLSKFIKGAVRMRPSFERRKEQLFWGAHFFLMFQLIILSGKNHDRNMAWSHSLKLWGAAYAVNPKSYHTMYNYGYELSLKQRFVEAEAVMRPIGSARVDGPTNTFVYAMVLFNLQQCDRSNVLLKEAFEVIEERRKEGGPRNTESSLSRTTSNLLVAKAHCTEDPHEKGRVLYEAVETDPTNEYAISMATNYMNQLKQFEELQKGNVL